MSDNLSQSKISEDLCAQLERATLAEDELPGPSSAVAGRASPYTFRDTDIQEDRKVLETLELHKKELASTVLKLRSKYADVKEREQQMMREQQKFDDTVKYQEAKHCSVMRKANNMRRLNSRVLAELQTLKDKFESFTQKQDQLARQLKKHEIYIKFMDKVVQDCPQDWDQLISRIKTLKQTNEELVQDYLQNQESILQQQTHLARITNQGNNTLLLYINKLGQLQTELYEVQKECMTLELKWRQIQETSTEKVRKLGRLKLAIYNLYKSGCRSGEEEIAPEDTLKQLDKILMNINDKTELLKKAQKPRTTEGD